MGRYSALLALALGAVVSGCGVVAAKEELEAQAEKVLVACEAERYEEVYREAAQAFRDSASFEEFRAYVEGRRKALGAFRRVSTSKGFHLKSASGSPTTGRISLDLEYERGPAQAELEFRKEDGAWRLGLLKVAFDEKLLPKEDRAALEPLAREILALYDAGSFVALYARFSKPLQAAWPAERYEPEIRDLHAKTGKVLEATLRETKDEADGKIRLLFDLRLDSGTGEAGVAFQWHAATWHVVGFHLHTTPR